MTTTRSLLLLGVALAVAAYASASQAQRDNHPRVMEPLDRGVVAAPSRGGGVLVSWRLLNSDPDGAGFNVYRDGDKVNDAPLTGATNLVDRRGQAGQVYEVRPANGGPGGRATALAENFLTIPLDPPTAIDAAGEPVTYIANDASVGDLDGDGDYEIVLKWDPSNSQDNAFAGVTSNTYFDAYTLEGERLWRIDMGRNIRSGAHYTQFLVFDFDGDGKAEFVAKTADGTTDALGVVIGDADADWRSGAELRPSRDRTGSTTDAQGRRAAQIEGRILTGPEYLTVFNGETGAAMATTDYWPQRHPDTTDPTQEQMAEVWGDGYGNRSDRFLGGVAFLDGEWPSIIMARGYYARTTIGAWDWRRGRLTQRWTFDSATPGNEAYGGQGNHQLAVADVDGDDRDEIIYGGMALDDDGTGLWTSGLLHGDALHVSDLIPGRPGLERFAPHESPGANGGIGTAMLDARTGERIWTTPGESDVGRGVALDIDPRYPGTEVWATNNGNLYSSAGEVISDTRPRQVNFGIYWDGDPLRELLDGNRIFKWKWRENETEVLLEAEGMASNNGTKATPTLSADILGDWREELVLRAEDNRSLRIYLTPYPTDRRVLTLMHDPVYRLAIAWQNIAYNQPPHLSYTLGDRIGY